jgi:ATP-dependent DNA ligase
VAQTPTLSIPLSLKPMEAEPVDELPRGKGWLYEPKYDGFRCLAFRDGDQVELHPRNRNHSTGFSRRWQQDLPECESNGSCWTASC